MSAHLQRAELLLDQSRPAEAEREASLALAGNPADPDAHALLARSRLAQQRPKEAIESARQAIALAPDVAYYHRVHGFVLLHTDRVKDAIAAANQALAIEPEEASTFILRSSAYLSQRQWTLALEDAEAALGLDAENVEAMNLRSMALTQLGRAAEAHETGDFALHRSPENGMAHAVKGWACLHQGEPAQAQEHFREALRLEPDLEYARQGMLEALKARNRIYRGMLSYFLWMGRQSTQIQWGFILVTLFGVRAVRTVASENPSLGILLWPIIGLCYTFIYLSWTATPMFNLLLRFDRFGRLVLSRDERKGSTYFGLSLLAILAAGLWWATTDGEAAMPATIAAAMLSVCVAATVGHEGRSRIILAIATSVLGIAAVASVWSVAQGTWWPLSVFFLSFLGFQFLANSLKR